MEHGKYCKKDENTCFQALKINAIGKAGLYREFLKKILQGSSNFLNNSFHDVFSTISVDYCVSVHCMSSCSSNHGVMRVSTKGNGHKILSNGHPIIKIHGTNYFRHGRKANRLHFA